MRNLFFLLLLSACASNSPQHRSDLVRDDGIIIIFSSSDKQQIKVQNNQNGDEVGKYYQLMPDSKNQPVITFSFMKNLNKAFSVNCNSNDTLNMKTISLQNYAKDTKELLDILHSASAVYLFDKSQRRNKCEIKEVRVLSSSLHEM